VIVWPLLSLLSDLGKIWILLACSNNGNWRHCHASRNKLAQFNVFARRSHLNWDTHGRITGILCHDFPAPPAAHPAAYKLDGDVGQEEAEHEVHEHAVPSVSRDNRSTLLTELVPMSVQAPGDMKRAAFVGTELVVLLLAELAHHHETMTMLWKRWMDVFFSRWGRVPEELIEKEWGVVGVIWAMARTRRRWEEKKMWWSLGRVR